MLDEPEAFLHPAQAFFLGKWIGENCASLGSQLLICTHSSNFLSGILTGTKDLGIFRLQRVENRTFYNRLPPNVANQLIGNPILSSQRVIEGIFHSGVVICEADADRAVYQSVAAICHNSNREVLFIHAHNKQTLALVAGVLKQTGTPVAVVADIDILRPKKDIDDVYKVLTGIEMPEELKAKQLQLDDFVESRPEEETLQEFKNNVSELIQQLEEGKHTFEGARSALSRIHRETSKWSAIKRDGIFVLPVKEKANAEQLIAELAKIGFFVVPVGELEGWIDLGTHKKNKWIVPALETVNSRNTPPDLSGFVGGIIKYFNLSDTNKTEYRKQCGVIVPPNDGTYTVPFLSSKNVAPKLWLSDYAGLDINIRFFTYSSLRVLRIKLRKPQSLLDHFDFTLYLLLIKRTLFCYE